MSSKSSASTQANQTQMSSVEDNRIVGEAGSLNLAGSDGNTVIVNSMDAGAVGKSFDFADSVTKGAASLAAASVGNMADLSRDALGAVKDSYAESGAMVQKNSQAAISAITSANSKVNDVLADAYKTSKAGEQKMLAFGALAVVGIVAAKVMGAR